MEESGREAFAKALQALIAEAGKACGGAAPEGISLEWHGYGGEGAVQEVAFEPMPGVHSLAWRTVIHAAEALVWTLIDGSAALQGIESGAGGNLTIRVRPGEGALTLSARSAKASLSPPRGRHSAAIPPRTLVPVPGTLPMSLDENVAQTIAKGVAWEGAALHGALGTGRAASSRNVAFRIEAVLSGEGGDVELLEWKTTLEGGQRDDGSPGTARDASSPYFAEMLDALCEVAASAPDDWTSMDGGVATVTVRGATRANAPIVVERSVALRSYAMDRTIEMRLDFQGRPMGPARPEKPDAPS